MDLYREATLRPCARGERGVEGDGDGADDGQSEAVVAVDAGVVESLEGLEGAVDLLCSLFPSQESTPMTDGELIDTYIEADRDRPGRAEARVAGYGVPVWALVGYLDAVHNDVMQVAHDYRLPIESVEAALAYYRRHKAFIDDRLAADAS